jgi:hypothetical protein
MGRLILKRLRPSRRWRQYFLGWALPIGLTLAIIFGVHTVVRADPAPSATELEQYLQNNELNLFEQPASEYSQVFYLYNRRIIQLTSENYPHLHPLSSGEYVAWQGVIGGHAQIFLYNVLTNALVQLTSNGSNEGIFVRSNTVAWQHWDGQHWQIYYYDGAEVRQITDNINSSSVRPSTNGSRIIYAEQLDFDHWKAQSYDINSGETTTMAEGNTSSTAYPQFNSDGNVSTAFVPY